MYHSFSIINKIKSSNSKNKCPLIYKSIKKEIFKKYILYNKFISNSCQENTYAYRLQRNKCATLIPNPKLHIIQFC